MKAKLLLVIGSAALCTAAPADVVGIKAPAGFPVGSLPGKALFDGEMTQEEFSRELTRSLQILAASGDQEAFDAIKKAKENGGRLEMTQEEAQKFIDRAKQGGAGGAGGGGGDGNAINAEELVAAIETMAKDGDADAIEAKTYVDKAKENGGKLEIPQDLLQKVVTKAREKGLMAKPEAPQEQTPEEPAKEEPPAKPDVEKVKEAIKLLAKKGDKDAQAVIDYARRNRGELKVTDDEARDFIKRAFPDEAGDATAGQPADPDPAKAKREKAEEAVRLLAKKGDKEAKAVIDRARRNRGEMNLTDEEAATFLDRAIEKELVEPDKANPGGEPERMPPQTVKQLIKILAERGDRDAKAIMRKAKKNDDEITYTKEEEDEIIKNAKEAGLID